jgi:hypothetical protein
MIRSIMAGLLALGGLATCGPGDAATNGKRPLEVGPRPSTQGPSPTIPPNGWWFDKTCDSLTFRTSVDAFTLTVQSGPTQWPLALNVVVPAGGAFSVDLAGEHSQPGDRIQMYVDDRMASDWVDC